MTVAYERAHNMTDLDISISVFHRVSRTTKSHYWQEGQHGMIQAFFSYFWTPNLQVCEYLPSLLAVRKKPRE